MRPFTPVKEIRKRFPVLLNRGMLKINVNGNILELSGKIEAVQAMDRHVMEKYMPNHCKAILKMEGNMDRSALYTYRFQANK